VNVADHYRSTLDELTRDPVGGPDLSAVIARGRRRRRVRRTAWAGAGVAAVVIAAVAGVSLTRERSSVAVEPVGEPSYQDFVAGTDLDRTLQATVARHLTGLPAAADVYPSDWNTPEPIPDADFADATEWHAVYDVSGTERLRVVMSQAIPDQPSDTRCARLEQSDIPCERVELPDGSVETRSGYLLGSTTYRFMTVLVAPDGFVVETLDDVRSDSVEGARAARQLTDTALSSLVRDAALRFPAPVHTPPPPTMG
jgi:hypothetical protein